MSLFEFKFAVKIPRPTMPPWPWAPKKHEHKFLPTGAQPQAIEASHSLFGGVIAPGPGTVVLAMCECGERQSYQLRGTWSLAEVQGKASEALDQFIESTKSAPKP